jgi:hypothetical protein
MVCREILVDDDTPDSLRLSRSDYVASAAKSALGGVPFAGSLLAEIAGTVIPNQRIDRIVRFAADLQKRIACLEQDRARMCLTDENFTDLVEEGLRQAARSTSDERRQHIASVLATSLTADDVSFIESRHLLRILGEINDIEVIWLRSYLDPAMGGDADFRTRHEAVLAPRVASLESSQSEIDDETIQASYKEHLAQLGLLRGRARIDKRTGLPEFGRDGRMKMNGYELTRLGRLLLRHLGFEDPLARTGRSPPLARRADESGGAADL